MPKQKIIVDTHYLIWDLQGHPNIDGRIESILTDPSNELYFSAISYWEIAMLVGKKKIYLSESVETVCHDIKRYRNYRVVDITPEISQIVSLQANQINGDPADRIIAATSVVMGAALLTRDQDLIARSFLKTL